MERWLQKRWEFFLGRAAAGLILLALIWVIYGLYLLGRLIGRAIAPYL